MKFLSNIIGSSVQNEQNVPEQNVIEQNVPVRSRVREYGLIKSHFINKALQFTPLTSLKEKIDNAYTAGATKFIIGVATIPNHTRHGKCVFMYDNANSFRIKKVKSYNANLVLSKIKNAFFDMEKASKEEGYTIIFILSHTNRMDEIISFCDTV